EGVGVGIGLGSGLGMGLGRGTGVGVGLAFGAGAVALGLGAGRGVGAGVGGAGAVGTFDSVFRLSATATGATGATLATGSCRARKTTTFLPASLAGALTVFTRKPDFVAVMRASASAGIPSKRKKPSSSVVAVSSAPFSATPTARVPAARATRTTAPGIGPALLSLTTPYTVRARGGSGCRSNPAAVAPSFSART